MIIYAKEAYLNLNQCMYWEIWYVAKPEGVMIPGIYIHVINDNISHNILLSERLNTETVEEIKASLKKAIFAGDPCWEWVES